MQLSTRPEAAIAASGVFLNAGGSAALQRPPPSAALASSTSHSAYLSLAPPVQAPYTYSSQAAVPTSLAASVQAAGSSRPSTNYY